MLHGNVLVGAVLALQVWQEIPLVLFGYMTDIKFKKIWLSKKLIEMKTFIQHGHITLE